MTKTVCDICGSEKVRYNCNLPIITVNYIKGGCPEKILSKFNSLEICNVDLCEEHAYLIAGFIETLKK